MYHFSILDTENTPDAEVTNAQLLGPDTLGIEVTVPAFAKRCGLGNIDPQHDGSKSDESSAIEAAMEWPIPPEGTRFVTIRLDKDSVGTMAVLLLRAKGKDGVIDHTLVRWIGALDRMPFHEAAAKYPECVGDRAVTDAMNYIVKAESEERWPTLQAKVTDIARIFSGDMPRKEIWDICSLRKRQRWENPCNFDYELHGHNVAFIEAPGRYEDARNWGNGRCPVCVVFDPKRRTDSGGLQQKWSVVRQPNVFDRVGFEKAINAAEARARGLSVAELKEARFAWGGNKNIVSSPQGAGFGTKLEKEEIIAIVCRHSESGIVS